MSIQLRQICLVAEKLAPAVADLTEILGIKACYIDPEVAEFGLENTLMPIGRNFLEVVAPVTLNTAAERYLKRRQGDGGYMVITQADTIENQRAMRQRAIDNEVRVAYESERDGWHLCQLHPGDLKAAFLEVEYDPFEDFQGHWMPAGGSGWEGCVQQDLIVDYLGVELQGEQPDALASLWASIVGSAVSDRDGVPVVPLNNAYLRFVPIEDQRGPGLGGLDVAVNAREAVLAKAQARGCYVSDHRVDICGTRFYLHDA